MSLNLIQSCLMMKSKKMGKALKVKMVALKNLDHENKMKPN